MHRLFVSEGMAESAPMLLLSVLFLPMSVGAHCQVMNCKPQVIGDLLGPGALELTSSNATFTESYATLLQAQVCDDLPMTEEGWFTMSASSVDQGQSSLLKADSLYLKAIQGELSAHCTQTYVHAWQWVPITRNTLILTSKATAGVNDASGDIVSNETFVCAGQHYHERKVLVGLFAFDRVPPINSSKESRNFWAAALSAAIGMWPCYLCYLSYSSVLGS